jgi:hypothetical protein
MAGDPGSGFLLRATLDPRRGIADGEAVKFAYADPPYIGQAKRHYAKEAEANGRVAAEVDHAALIARLCDEFPHGWALSCHTPSLRILLPMCPEDVRIGAWVKPFHVFKKGVRPAYAWEPVLFRGGRNAKHPPPPKGGKATTPKDFVSANITLKRGTVGAKPEAFCRWIFDILGMRAEDEFHDLFPGSGAVTRAWEKWQGQVMMELVDTHP